MKLLHRPRVRRSIRYISMCVMLVAALLAAAIVASLTVDLGPLARRAAETQGSKYIERPLRIGRLSIHVLTGKYVIDEMIIDGLHPGDRPFFTAKRISIAIDWAAAMRLRPEFLITSVELTDWQMLVEKWENSHNMPRFTRDDQPQGPRRFTTTVQYVHASRGQFTYEDHQTPWSIVCPNLDFTLGNVPNYHGQAVFNGGTVQIQNYKPMWANLRARFVLSGPHVDFDRIEIDTDGGKTVARGSVELGKRWPEQSYDFESRVQFSRMGDIFFSDQDWNLTGDGDVAGKFHLFKGGHDLGGTFKSDVLGWKDYRFPALAGSLRWTPTAFDVWDASAKFFGGDAQFTYSIKPLGRKSVRSTSRFEASYESADLAAFTDFQNWRGLRFAGSMSGHNLLEWPTGRFIERRDEGSATVVPPPGVQPMTARAIIGDVVPLEREPLVPAPLPAHVPVAAAFAYRFTADNLELDPSYFATDRTHVAFQGATRWGEQSRVAFHVTSRDWQESDQLLAGLIKNFGSSSDAVVAIGGRGEFDGVMTGPFRRARIEGTFSGEDLRAWDTTWGAASARILYEDGVITVIDGSVRLGDSEIRTNGLFSLVTPRQDGRDEIDAQFRVTRRDLESLRHAFQIDEYPISGRMSGEFRLKGERQRPMGVGSMRIDEGVAYGEPFQNATASLRFDGAGIRLDGIEIAKGTGTITGAAFIGWDSTYSFSADGRRIPAGQIAFLTYPGVPLSGAVQLSASGSGTFDVPRNDFTFRISDLAVDQEAVGQVNGDFALRDTDLSGQIDAASPRLSVSGAGRISLTPDADSEISLRFHDTSIDQYVRLFVPGIPASMTAVASGSMHLAGALTDFDHLAVDGTIDALDMRLFDFAVKNAAPIRLALDRGQVSVQDLQLVGEDTRLRVTGSIGLREDQVGLKVSGAANLAIVQGFFRDVRGSGRAELTAAVDGPLRRPVLSGSVTIAEGRIRHFSLPNALDSINGTVSFDASGVRLDGLTAEMGGGQVRFGGRIGFDGYQPGDLNVTVSGEDMQLRLFEGMRSTFDADLALVGSYQSPTLGGTVRAKSAVWTRRIDAPGSIFDFARRASGGRPVIVGEAPTTFPLRYDVRIEAPSTLRVDTNLLRLVASADLTLQGSYDRPVVVGHAEIERGDVNFEGRRYRITRGAIDFNNPTRTEPFFDIEAETDVRVPGPPVQTYHINVGFVGTTERLQPTVSSDPALPPADVLALLFSDVRRNNQLDVELRALQNPNQAETDILAARATQALTAPISAEVGKVVEEAFGVDTFQLTPSFVDPSGQQTSGLNPTARLTIGKRVSDRVYLTFSRSLGTSINDQIVLLEYEESDRLSWILSRNEDQQTYALEFRVRHTF